VVVLVVECILIEFEIKSYAFECVYGRFMVGVDFPYDIKLMLA
jgi:hypothetical protein